MLDRMGQTQTERHTGTRPRNRWIVALAASLATLAAGAAEPLTPPSAPPGGPPVVAQVPWFAQRQPQPPQRRTPSARRQDPPPDSGEFIWAKDLADRIKQIDPAAVVEWDGRVLRVEASGQKFSMFPRSNQVVVNGNLERVSKALRIANDEIYVPVEAVELIGRQLEEVLAAATPTPVPDTPETTTTTDVAAVTPTPAPTASPLPTETPLPTPAIAAMATPAPTPVATPTPESIGITDARPTPRATRATPRPATTAPPAAGGSLYNTLLRERAEMASFRIAKFTEAELQALAGVTTLKKVVIDPDDGPDPAAGSLGAEASELSLELARKVAARLKMRGIETELTRNGPQRVALGRKLEIVTNSGAQALVSLRVGISGFSDASGARVFYTNDSVDFRMGRPAARDASGTAAPETNYLPFQQRSEALALALLDAVKRGALREDTADASPAPLWLARRAPMASALVMLGYVTNSLDALILRDPQRQDGLADALAESIAGFATALEAPAPASTRRPGVASAP